MRNVLESQGAPGDLAKRLLGSVDLEQKVVEFNEAEDALEINVFNLLN